MFSSLTQFLTFCGCSHLIPVQFLLRYKAYIYPVCMNTCRTIAHSHTHKSCFNTACTCLPSCPQNSSTQISWPPQSPKPHHKTCLTCSFKTVIYIPPCIYIQHTHMHRVTILTINISFTLKIQLKSNIPYGDQSNNSMSISNISFNCNIPINESGCSRVTAQSRRRQCLTMCINQTIFQTSIEYFEVF